MTSPAGFDQPTSVRPLSEGPAGSIPWIYSCTCKGILLVCYAEYPGAFGLSARIDGLRAVLSESGIRSVVLCPISRKSIRSGGAVVDLGPEFLRRLYESSLGRLVGFVLFSLSAIAPIISHSNRDALLMQYESLFSAFPTIVAKALLRKKVIGDEVILMSAGARGPFRYLLHALDRIFVRMTDYITTSSLNTFAVIRKWFPTKAAYLVPNGVTPLVCEHERSLDMRELIFVGSLSSHENRIAVENVLGLAGILERKGTMFHINVVGGPWRFSLPYLEHETVKRGRVTFLGVLDDEQLEALYGRASMGLLPFFRPSEGLGGTRIKGLEYLRHGLLVVSGPYGFGTSVGIGKGTHFLEAEDLDEMSELVAECISHPMLYSRIAAAGRELVEARFSWTAVSKPYLDLVRRLMELPDGGPSN